MLDSIDLVICSVEELVETKRRRHIIGGSLLSLSVLLGGLAITVITIKQEDN